MAKFLLWCIRLVLCWPLAVLALILSRMPQSGHPWRGVTMTRGARWQQFSRRDAMRLLGAGTAGFVAAYGGPGYAKTVTQFAPMLREAGLDEATVQSFIADNPRRWLAFTPAKWPVS